MKIDDKDRKILKRVQRDFPLERRPFKKLAEELDMEEEYIIDRLRKFSEEGYIRNISPKIRSNKVGYNASTLVAVKVEDSRIEEVAEVINEYKGVTHNYERDAEYNLWFTLHAGTEKVLENILENIRERTEPEEMLNLPKEKKYKLEVNLDLEDVKDG